MTYLEYKRKREREFNELPIFFVFTNEQLEKELNKRGLTLQDTGKLYRLGDTGGFYLKSDADKIRAYFDKSDDLPNLMNDDKFAESAFEYEMDNHEYAINYQGDWDVCSCFCKHCEWSEMKDYTDYLTENGHADWIPAYSKARKRHMKKAENW